MCKKGKCIKTVEKVGFSNVNVNQNNIKKTNTGKTVLGLGGLAAGSYLAVGVLEEKSYGTLYRDALSSLGYARSTKDINPGVSDSFLSGDK